MYTDSEMNIVTVIPIAKGVFKDQLTYFCPPGAQIGSLVTVPVRGRAITGLVTEVRSVTDLKSELKSSGFALKKVTAIKNHGIFLPEFLRACQKTADYFAGTFGQTIKTAVPETILAHLELSRKPVEKIASPKLEPDDGTVKQNKFILQDSAEERLSYYKALIRESFAQKSSVLLCLPTKGDVLRFTDSFGAGIRDYTIILEADLAKKTLWQNWNRAITETHPLLIIATPGFLALPRSDIKTIILEKESHSSYKNISRPFIDFRVLAEHLATELSARLILGDLVLRAETIFRAERGELAHLSSMKYRSVSTAEQFILDTKNRDTGDKNAYAISDALREHLAEAVTNREKIVIYSGRKGLSPVTICNDCGLVANCPNCHSPFVLHKNNLEKKYYYLCHKCGNREEPQDKCAHCDSWRLSLLGAGIEKVEQELGELFPTIPLFRLDSGNTKPTTRAETVKRFYETKGPAILIGTEIMLPLLSEKTANIAVVAIDALFSMPDFRISEKILGLLLSLRQWAGKRFMIQTRNPEEKVFRYATAGNLIDFYREEIEERMKFGYPPFKILVKISHLERAGDDNNIQSLVDLLADYSPLIYPGANDEARGQTKMHAIIKLPTGSGVSADLLARLKSLPPEWLIQIEPDSIL